MTNPDFSYSFDPKACESCGGKCCTGESGYIWVTLEEIHEIAQYKKVDFKDFISQFVVQIGRKFSIKEVRVNSEKGVGYECAFFDSKKAQCTIYPLRPVQCRTFPFWDYFKDHVDEVVAECPGILR